MSEATTQTRTGAPAWGWPLFISAAAIAVYLGTITHGFVFDDGITIVNNPYIQSLDVARIFALPEGTRAGLHQLYRPLLNVTLAFNYALTALQPWSYHVFNILLHGLVSVLVFFVAREWRLSAGAALAGALLFAVHPIHVEVVANITGRKDALTAAFALAMAALHPRARRLGGVWIVAPVACFLGAMFSKENGVAAVGLVALQDLLLRHEDGGEKTNWRRLLLINSGYAGALIAFVLARSAVVGAGVGLTGVSFFDNPLMRAQTDTRLMTAVAVIGKGLALQLWPVGQSPDYSFNAIPLVSSAGDPRFLATVAVIAAVGALATAALRRGCAVPALAAGWYFAALLPTANLLFPVGTIFGERLLYLPSVGFCLFAGWGIGVIVSARRGAALVAVTGTCAALLAVQTVRYAAAWRSDFALIEVGVRHAPDSAKVHYKLGQLLLAAGRRDEALREVQRAAEIAPDHEYTVYGLASMLRELNRLDEAREAWLRVLRIRPDHAPALSDLGTYYSVKGNPDRAIAYLERAAAADPGLAVSWFNLGLLYRSAGRSAEAARALQQFIRVADQDTWGPQISQARALLAQPR